LVSKVQWKGIILEKATCWSDKTYGGIPKRSKQSEARADYSNELFQSTKGAKLSHK